MIILGDSNARMGNSAIPGVEQRFNKNTLNDNGQLMINLRTFNEMRIYNTLFDHKDQYEFTFRYTRGLQYTIDYILTNRYLHPCQILDVETLNSANVGSDNSLLLGKNYLKFKLRKTRNLTVSEEKILY